MKMMIMEKNNIFYYIYKNIFYFINKINLLFINYLFNIYY